jgi:aspartate/methionine/tyrosine aminotransferase
MRIETFLLERNQSLYENEVEINLTESGVEPMTLWELFTPDELHALHRVRLGYNFTEGTPELREAIATWYPGASREEVLVTTGAAEANFVATWTLVEPGASIAFMVPNFMQIHGLARMLGADVRTFPLTREKGWRPDLDALRAAVDEKTRLIAIVNPNNPTGAVLDEADLDGIIEIAHRVGAWVLADEIYRGSELDGRPEAPTLWGRYERAIVTSSTSKSLAHAGLRIGWAVAPKDMISELVRRQDYTTIGTGPINQWVAARILEPERRGRILARSRTILQANLSLIDSWVARSGGRLTYDRPQAGGMAFIAYDLPINSTELSRQIREQEGVFVVAGDWLGMGGHLRIGTGGHAETLAEGLRRIDRTLDRLASAGAAMLG